MKSMIYCLYDSKIEAYLQPFFMQSKGLAVRAFTDLANDPEHQFGTYPNEFSLFEVGEFNCLNCQFLLHNVPMPIGSANEFIRPKMVDVTKS